MKIQTKIYQRHLDCRTESIETGISKYGTVLPDSIENVDFERWILLTIGHKGIK